jgi:hypothetical protein
LQGLGGNHPLWDNAGMQNRFLLVSALLFMTGTPGCGSGGSGPAGDAGFDGNDGGQDAADTGHDAGMDAADAADAGTDARDGGPGDGDVNQTDDGWQCPVDPCVVVDGLPFEHSADTSESDLGAFDSYGCAPGVGEAGPEVVYVLELTTPGVLVAMLDDGGEVGADIDIHLLSDLDPDACLARAHIGFSRHLAPGRYFLVADSWSDAGGQAYPGPYTLYLRLVPDASRCAMLFAPIRRIGDDAPLTMPATGPVVREAHLVTDEEFIDGSWPQSTTDGIQQHYDLSQAATGYVMDRSEPWCPCCEPSNEYGQGSSSRPPPEAEAFYLCMRWAEAPPRGQRYIVFDGRSGKAVVAAAGYENGPGDLGNIGGACEEIHHHLGSTHLSVLTFGVAVDQTLPYGPIDCNY